MRLFVVLAFIFSVFVDLRCAEAKIAMFKVLTKQKNSKPTRKKKKIRKVFIYSEKKRETRSQVESINNNNNEKIKNE